MGEEETCQPNTFSYLSKKKKKKPQKLAHGTSHTILYTPNATQVAKMLIKKIKAKTGNFGTANGCQTRVK